MVPEVFRSWSTQPRPKRQAPFKLKHSKEDCETEDEKRHAACDVSRGPIASEIRGLAEASVAAALASLPDVL